MNQTITITPSWQIHIPLNIRKKLKMTKPGLAKVTVRKGKMIVSPEKSSLLSFAGKFKSYVRKKKVDIDHIRDVVDYSQL